MKTTALLFLLNLYAPLEVMDTSPPHHFQVGFPGTHRHDERTLFMYTDHGIIFLRPGEPAHDIVRSTNALRMQTVRQLKRLHLLPLAPNHYNF
jgi:hypothetical protein